MSKPVLAIVGRPNVGKSTLFNKIVGRRISIVEDTPGVTRDRIYADAEWLRHKFTVIDTGGLDPDSDDVIIKQIYRQAEVAMEAADVILLVVDVKAGPLDADKDAANILRKTKKPVLLVVNKVDDMRKENLDFYEFYSLGLGEPIAVSSGQGLGIGDLLDEIAKRFPEPDEEAEIPDAIRVAVTGKPNVGKSSLINKVLGKERLIVSDIPGTTRDSVDSLIERGGQKYVFVDTAGLRRKSKIKEKIERYAIVRAVSSIDRSDVSVLLIDAEQGVSEQDSKIAGIAHDHGRASIVAVNKWDKIEKDNKTMDKFTKDISVELAFMAYAPKIFISALTGQRIDKLFELIQSVYQNHNLRISTGMLNDVLIEAMAVNQPPADRGKQLKIYYATQASVRPPKFVLFVNNSELMHYSYLRYIENQLRQSFGFSGTPLQFILRDKNLS
ncbi:MAG: ribosome biogenesis GTPase Der [Clostridiales bacterium]|jgi:GTP-binding protein|nr:ribosome biogenesis GTPase Der [Clostridiales bacterium]